MSDADEIIAGDDGLPAKEWLSYTASLIIQGNHRFYSLTVPSDVLASTCTVDSRIENPMDGFQRKLDKRRAEDIARYIDEGFGTIPCSIVLSAQDRSEFKYTRGRRTVRFRNVPGAFLILDGQHRVFGFALAKSKMRVPVVVYRGLSRANECRLFMDINTKQRPVPNELLLDIKRLAETETDDESFLRDVYDKFNEDSASPLLGLLCPAMKVAGKISRVTFNAAVRSAWSAFQGSDAERAYKVLAAYLHGCRAGLRLAKAEKQLTNPTLFRAIVFLFPDVAQRVADRHGEEFSAEHFAEVLRPFFSKVKRADLRDPGTSHLVLHDNFRKALRQQFTISP